MTTIGSPLAAFDSEFFRRDQVDTGSGVPAEFRHSRDAVEFCHGPHDGLVIGLGVGESKSIL